MENSAFLSQHDGAGVSIRRFNVAPPSDQVENCAHLAEVRSTQRGQQNAVLS